MPVPVGQHGTQHRFHLPGRVLNRLLHANDLLFRLVALDIAFQGNLQADSADRLAVRLLLDSVRDDRFQHGNSGLGQALLDGVVVLLPGFLAINLRRQQQRYGHSDHDHQYKQLAHWTSLIQRQFEFLSGSVVGIALPQGESSPLLVLTQSVLARFPNWRTFICGYSTPKPMAKTMPDYRAIKKTPPGAPQYGTR